MSTMVVMMMMMMIISPLKGR